MFSRRLAHFAPAAAASATAVFCGSASDTSAQVSNRLAPKLYRNAIRHLSDSKRLKSTDAAAATTTTGAASKPKQKSSFVDWYESHLETNPVKTKMVSGSMLWGLGDVVAQTVPVYAAGDTLKKYDYARTGRAVCFGFFIHAPASHLHFNFLEWMTVKSGMTGMSIPVFKTFMEQFVYWSWFSNSLYHGAMGAMQGQSAEQIYQHISDVLWETQKAQWAFWIPIQLLNFKFVPVRHQLNVVLLTSVVWTALLSMWYPPVSEDDEKKETTTKQIAE